MSRRRSVRRARRVQVQFWKRGEPHAYPGYTTNISTTGMFIATRSPLPQGTRVRVEVLDRDRGFMVEGMVAHARKVRGELMRISQPGMGVRFLSVEDLVKELIPVVQWGEEEIPDKPVEAGEGEAFDLEETVPPPQAVPASKPMPLPPVPSASAAPASPPPTAAPLISEPGRTDGPLSFGSPAPEKPRNLGDGVYSVRFASPKEFVEVFERDIVNGGLFVPTRYPGRLQEVVNVELLPPVPFAEPVRARARVVHRLDPRSSDLEGANLLSGMGLELLDVQKIVEQLRPVVERLRG